LEESMSHTNEVARKLDDAISAIQNRPSVPLLDRVIAELQACFDSPAATEQQRQLAHRVIGQITCARNGLDPLDNAFQAGRDYEQIRSATMVGPAESGDNRGVHWFGYWVPLDPVEQKLLLCVAKRFRGERVDIPLADVVKEVWNLRNVPEALARLKTAKGRVHEALEKHNPPIDLTMSIRGDVLVVEGTPPTHQK